MPVNQLYALEIGALLHDIGKIGVPDAVLLKPGSLTATEWELMELHGRIGEEIIDICFNNRDISDIIRFHHCRFDGKGQTSDIPKGEDIPLAARIVCIVDAYDAMVSDRVYRKGRPPEEAFDELKRCAGSQFDPQLVERFIQKQTGWRLDSRMLMGDYSSRTPILLGSHLERVMASFNSCDEESLKRRLQSLQEIATHDDIPHLASLIHELRSEVERKSNTDWDCLKPMLQDVVDAFLSMQRAYLRQIGFKSLAVDSIANQIRIGEPQGRESLAASIFE
jgi:hypothetical protein